MNKVLESALDKTRKTIAFPITSIGLLALGISSIIFITGISIAGTTDKWLSILEGITTKIIINTEDEIVEENEKTEEAKE